MKRTLVILLLLATCPLSAAPAAERAPMPARATPQAIRTSIIPVVAELRGLAFDFDVAIKTTTPSEVAQYVRYVIDKEMPDKQLKGYEKTLRYMGLIEPGVDLKQAYINALSQNIAGFYDDEDKSFSIVTQPGIPSGLDAVTAAHELTHALQDHYFDLNSLREFVRHNDDAGMAVMALAEGDASDIMVRYMTASYPRGQGPVKDYSRFLAVSTGPQSFPGLPLVVSQDLIFPYTYGTKFLITLLQEKGHEAVDIAFRDPPVSTEQIIYPERYFKRDEPVVFDLTSIEEHLPDGWRLADAEPLGQFNLGIYLATHLGTWGVDETVSPWEGDVMAGFEGPGRDDFFFAYLSAWDSPVDADRFFSTYRRLLEVRFPSLEPSYNDKALVTWTLGNRLYYLARRGSKVLSVENVPRAFAADMIMRLWQSKETPFGIARPVADRDRSVFLAAPGP